ncbi:translation initiation factor eIF-2B subunit delta [Halovenus aranensis]|uniref:Translation initiation factor eIF-2B subunit delta n=1 Tax=Halovenus aranensis TaxID=890420 RepID=A0A1G8YZM0_9EURY|nr:translation initiation factor eIF-2B [Halovenus aranensis]SDK08302.1 translation initiation factor eIF-2B subunit delta [Halovenus aranensis]
MIDETAEEIAEMQTHSSSEVAIKAARALRAVTDREFPSIGDYKRNLERNSNALRRANPSHASLHNTQREIVRRVDESDTDTVSATQRRTTKIIDEVIDRVEQGKDAAARRLADQLGDRETLLTHDYSTTVLSAIETAVEDGGEYTVYVTESRPRYLGRKTARRLAETDGVEATLVVDSAAGSYLSACDRVVVGMTCIVDRTLYNRVGTYPLTATAADADVPVVSVGSGAKLIEGGFRFENEHRATSEVMREPADGFEIENPAYDATPVALLDRIVTDEETIDPASLG